MFYAATRQKDRINADEYAKITEKNLDIFCPGCGEPIFFKNGMQKLPHFSHYANTDCRQFSEGETALHLLGKQRLFEWLKKLGMKVEMEAWLPELRQRPDLLVEDAAGRRLVLEYQCSPISFTDLQNRTKGYVEQGYEVMWLCGIDYQIEKSISNKQSQFVQWGNGTSFLTFQSETNQLMHYSQFYYNKRNELQCTQNCYSLEKLSFIHLEALYRGRVRMNKLGKTKTYPNSPAVRLLSRRDQTHRHFMERVYLARQNLQTLPSWLFALPTKTLFYQEPSYIWKFDFLVWLKGKGEGGLLERIELDEYFPSVKVQPVLFVDQSVLLQPLGDFIGELTQRGLLQPIGPEMWRIGKVF